LSHYFLRLAYCRNKDLRDWFVRQENFIFRARLDDLKNINTSRSAELLVKELEKLKAKHGEKLCPVERVFHTPQKENKDLKRIEAYYRSYIEESELDLSRGLLRVLFVISLFFITFQFRFLSNMSPGLLVIEMSCFWMVMDTFLLKKQKY